MGTPPSASNSARDRLASAWAGAGDEKAVAEIEAQVDLESAELWAWIRRPSSVFRRSPGHGSRTPDDDVLLDLAEIQRSLTELQA